MKALDNYINEVLVKHNLKNIKIKPKTKKELQQIIIDRIQKEGPECDLNYIDVSGITDMAELFDVSEVEIFKTFNGNVSEWNVKNVEDMQSMFANCELFNQDLSNWNVSKVKNMSFMFSGCAKFNKDISKWNVSNVEDMGAMFEWCDEFNCDISKWDVSKVKDMRYMFNNCTKFNKDISKWDVSKVLYNECVFEDCPIKKQYMPKFK